MAIVGGKPPVWGVGVGLIRRTVLYDIETVSALSNGIVVVASQSRPAQRFVRWGGGKRQTPRLKWAASEFNLGLPEEDKYILDGLATPDEVWQIVNGKTAYSVTDPRGVKHWFESEDKATTFVFEDVMTS
jgi:hypothetical protein